MKFDSPGRSDERDATSTMNLGSERAASTGDDDPPSDRMAVHLVWEIGLLLLAGGVLFALTRSSGGPFAEGSWTGLFAALAPVIMLASGMAVSLRVGAVNLAVGPIALLAAWIFVDASGSGAAVSLGMGLGAAVFVGVVLATLTAWLRAPGWAASGAIGGAIGLWAGSAGDPGAFALAALPNTGVLAALAGAAGLSLFLGLVGAFAGVRARLAPIRATPAGEPHGRSGLVFVGVLLSSTLAGAAGVVAAWTAVPDAGAAGLPDPILLTVVALGAALLGGTSLMGRRGGVCGTVFAATLVLALMWLAEARGWTFDPSWIALSAIVAGFLVTRLVEAMNTVDDAEAASTSRAGSIEDLREDDPRPTDRDTGAYAPYDEDFAGLGAGGGDWKHTGGITTTGGIPKAGAGDPFGASGVFDDLRDSSRDGYGSPPDRRYGRLASTFPPGTEDLRMTYVPPDRDEPAQDQTRQLDFTPAPAGRPELAHGIDERAQHLDPFAGPPALAVGYAERPEARKDRVVFQFVWEAILLLLTLNALFLVYRREEELFGDDFTGLSDALESHALYLTPILLAALAIGLSLRLGAVNLAVPALAIAIPLASPVESNVWLYLGYVAGAAVVAGLLYTLLVAAFRAPAWFAGLAIGAVVFASLPVLDRFAEWRGVASVDLPSAPNGLYVLGGAAVLAVAGGLMGLAPGVRNGFSAVKRLADGPREYATRELRPEGGERPASAVFLLLGGTVLSMLLAAGAGFLTFMYALGPVEGDHSLNFGMNGVPPVSVEPQVLAFGIALLAGTSLWGRRGGVFGTVLATVGVWAGLVLWGRAVSDAGEGSWQADYSQAIFAGVLLLGVFVSFALDRLGRPKDTVEPEDEFDMHDTQPIDPNHPDHTLEGTGLFNPDRPEPMR
ncbi:hypothetical protein K3N28_05250 [Glycomyces sp. TRM65418]|uniref:hypothetical protein n=1 Tax=Glycomyces sp. TRM65418 TaxID=2867006 RepID=UPI001CE633AF|nr:hypothetical protein [Glycomyces sp. TRM65418]MCC3762474.1 hypothetical protein [Glycomyces sp. TRM65418]QZD56518.1 hypothetical protein K3N28_05210 [Glycomyces sp. TRM65418]